MHNLSRKYNTKKKPNRTDTVDHGKSLLFATKTKNTLELPNGLNFGKDKEGISEFTTKGSLTITTSSFQNSTIEIQPGSRAKPKFSGNNLGKYQKHPVGIFEMPSEEQTFKGIVRFLERTDTLNCTEDIEAYKPEDMDEFYVDDDPIPEESLEDDFTEMPVGHDPVINKQLHLAEKMVYLDPKTLEALKKYGTSYMKYRDQ